jgi:hypothetical protein
MNLTESIKQADSFDQVTQRQTSAEGDAIITANAYLSNVGLPTYTELADLLDGYRGGLTRANAEIDKLRDELALAKLKAGGLATATPEERSFIEAAYAQLTDDDFSVDDSDVLVSVVEGDDDEPPCSAWVRIWAYIQIAA